MAWVDSILHHKQHEILLGDGYVVASSKDSGEVWFNPPSREDAHCMALMLRRAARHLETIGQGLD